MILFGILLVFWLIMYYTMYIVYPRRKKPPMKVTGIIRKLDMLGRIVIPREYRKMLKIKEADPLEIIAMDNGDILVRKVDIAAELVGSGQSIVDEVHQMLGIDVMLTDGDKYLAGAGVLKSQLTGTILSSKAQGLIEHRKCFNGRSNEISLDGADYVWLCPVFGSDVFGSLILFADKPIEAADGRVLQLTAKILGNSIQRF